MWGNIPWVSLEKITHKERIIEQENLNEAGNDLLATQNTQKMLVVAAETLLLKCC